MGKKYETFKKVVICRMFMQRQIVSVWKLVPWYLPYQYCFDVS